jgi:hypothetical protein
MPANPNWVRWIFASVAVYLKEVATDAELPSLVEGLDDRDDAFMHATDRVEIRINGPFTQETSRGCYRIFVDANVLLSSRYDGAKKNGYQIHKFAGLFHEAMDSVIPVFKHGLEPGDDSDVQIGCLSPRPGKNDSVRVIQLGQIEKTDRVKQSMVDARYIMYLND